jgi:TRAP-type C4-dicarboxylate transport system permease small subunit
MANEASPSGQTPLGELIFIKAPHVIGGVLFLVAATINIVNVAARYLFAAPIFWAEEILVFIVVWSVFLVAGSITYRGAHLNMDLIYASLPPFWKRLVNAAILITLVACSFFVAFESWKIVTLHARNNAVTAGTGIPLVFPTAALLVGFSFIGLAAIVRFRAYLTGKFE